MLEVSLSHQNGPIIDPNKNFDQTDAIVKSVFGTSKHLPHAEFEMRVRGVCAFRTTVRTLPRVARALKPKPAALISGQVSPSPPLLASIQRYSYHDREARYLHRVSGDGSCGPAPDRTVTRTIYVC